MGFFHDMALAPGRAVKQSDWASLESRLKAFVKVKQPFERLEVSKNDLQEMFKYSKYKLHYIEKFIPDGGSSTVYRSGSLVDLCLGPHIQNTRQIAAFKIQGNSAAYFLGDSANDFLQRISAVAFPNNAMMKDWDTYLTEAKERGHALMFASEERSYRHLPWRVADFSVLHRNEASGALSGLTRVRKFQQDDAHIFCTLEQVTAELHGMFDFMTHVYAMFGFPLKLKLSTRPDSYMGKLEEWDAAEEQLKQALRDFKGDEWVLNPGDGAFYGPKIDVTVSDALGREFQCATIQLDFQLPQNFKLQYRTRESPAAAVETEQRADGSLPPGLARPVMAHRAVIGSFERFMAITEHFGGKWPFWLSPRQIMVIPITKDVEDYANEVKAQFHKARFYVDLDVSGDTLQKKVRNAQLAQYNFVVLVGAQERKARAVNIRNRDDPKTQQKGDMVPLHDAVHKLKVLRDERRLKISLE